jgi:hypothetical protein
MTPEPKVRDVVGVVKDCVHLQEGLSLKSREDLLPGTCIVGGRVLQARVPGVAGQRGLVLLRQGLPPGCQPGAISHDDEGAEFDAPSGMIIKQRPDLRRTWDPAIDAGAHDLDNVIGVF